MKIEQVSVPMKDGTMSGYLVIPEGRPLGAVIAIMEIWGVNDTMRRHAQEFAEAGFVCLVPDLFWRHLNVLQMWYQWQSLLLTLRNFLRLLHLTPLESQPP